MNNRHGQKGIVALIVIIIIAVVGIGYLLLSSTLLKTNINNGLSNTDSNSKPPSDNNMLQTACKNAINDYPQWTKTNTDIIIWENPDKTFEYRNSPEDASMRIDSPVKTPDTLVDMDFVGENEVSYVKKGNTKWGINIFKLKGMSPPENTNVYEKTESISYINISPINKNEFIVFYTNGNKAFLKYLNTSNSDEKVLLETSVKNTDDLKLAVSPKGTYTYLLYDNALRVFEIVSKKQSDEINSVKSVVWIGNNNLLYSNKEETFIYNNKTKEKSKVSNLGPTTNLSFNPKDNGVIAYTKKEDATVINCKTWKNVGSNKDSKIRTLTSEKTAIMEMKDFFGYWRFKDANWNVRLFEGKISNFATVWKRY